MTFVVDSSVTVAWCFEEERTPATATLLAQAMNFGAAAPSLWPLEVLNALLMAEKRKRLDSTRRHELISALQSMPITLDTETATQAWSTTTRLAERHRLTLYDAAYLELAQRLELPLATLDADLRQAAKNLSVPLLGMPNDTV